MSTSEGTMRRTSLTLLATSFAILLQAAPVHAQAFRTWVSGVGDDANPCSRTAPCKTFAGAISKTAVNGEINCLDPGGFGAVTITKSITIDCHEVFASILNAGTNGINIPFDNFAATDARKTVRLRNINFNGVDTGLNGIRITGGGVVAGGTVFIEDCLIDGNFGGTARGISDERISGGKLFVSNTTVRNLGQTGIGIAPASGTTRLDAVLDNVHVQNGAFGVAVAGGTKVMISRSVFSGHTQAGVFAGASAEVNLSNSVVSSNNIAVQNAFGTPVIRLSNNDITLNGTAFSGATQSFSNNRTQGNILLGLAPTPIGATSNPTGLQ
jgi:Right handed beta helix region